MDDTAKVDAYLRMYERQMTHYERTQDVEWKGSFGVWTLLAAAIYWAAQNAAAPKPVTVESCLVVVVFLFPALHGLWLWRIHGSEEFDKKLWSRYRRAVREILSVRGVRRDEIELTEGGGLGWIIGRLSWIALEAGVTLVMASVIGLFLYRAAS